MPLPAVLQKYANRIQSNWQKATEGIFEVARLCAEANSTLTADQKKQLIDSLPFNASAFSKLAAIGADKRLKSARIQKLLPPNYTKIYPLTKLSDRKLKQAVDRGVIHPTVKRVTLDAFFESQTDEQTTESIKPPKPKVPHLSEYFHAAIRLTRMTTIEEDQRLEELLKAIRDELDADIVYPRNKAMEEYHRWQMKFDAFVRKEASKIIANAKRRKFSRYSASELRKMSPMQKKEIWGFSEDETEIKPDSTDAEVREALEVIGNEGVFEQILEQARREFPEPDAPIHNEFSTPDIIDEKAIEEMRAERERYDRIMGRKRFDKSKFKDFI